MAESVIRQFLRPNDVPKYVILHLDNANGRTATINLGAADNIVSILLSVSGVGGEHNSFYYLAGYGTTNTNNKSIASVLTATNVTVVATNTGFQIANTHTQHGCWAYLLIQESRYGRLTITQST